MKKKLKYIWYTIINFVANNVLISLSGAFALMYCCVCAFFKMSPAFNIPVKFQPWGELANNISISIIAAVIFYIVQVYMPNRKRTEILNKYAKRFLKDYLLKECKILLTRMDAIYKGENAESEIKDAININCQKVKYALTESLNRYLSVLSDELIDGINKLLFDDMFEMICLRSSGFLVNYSLEEIVKNRTDYNCFASKIEKIETETAKI